MHLPEGGRSGVSYESLCDDPPETDRFRAPGRQHPIIGELADIEPLRVAAYIEALENNFEKPTVKQHLAAIRMLLSPRLALPQPYPLT